MSIMICLKAWRRKHKGSIDSSPTASTTDGIVDTQDSFSTAATSSSDKLSTLSETEKLQKKLGKVRSKKLDEYLKSEWRKDKKFIQLLLLGPGEAGKSTLIKQMELIHGATLNDDDKQNRIKYIRQNIFDSMVAILVAMQKILGIELADESLQKQADNLLSHSQVMRPELTSKDILDSNFLQSDEFIDHVKQLWEDEGVQRAYSRSSEYQLLDCAAYFFSRLDDIRQPDYLPSTQDVLRCRIMTTSITTSLFATNYQNRPVNFQVLDVGGQQGERRKWITLFENVMAVLYVHDVSSFDQTLREDSRSNRLLESLKVFFQVLTTKYLSSVSILTFMNKIDILKEKIERGANFEEAISRITEEAYINSQPGSGFQRHDRYIYGRLYEVLANNPYSSFNISDHDRKVFSEAFPQPEPDHNHNHSVLTLTRRIQIFRKKSSQIDIKDEVVKAATYMQMLLQQIKLCVDQETPVKMDSFRAYEYHFTCAVDKANITKVIDGCKNIIVKKYLNSIIPL